jgi:hypothetical protein
VRPRLVCPPSARVGVGVGANAGRTRDPGRASRLTRRQRSLSELSWRRSRVRAARARGRRPAGRARRQGAGAQAARHGARIVRARARRDGRGVVLEDSTRLEGDIVVWACGPWLARLFPELVTLSVRCQELLFFDGGPPWRATGVPSWCDYDQARLGTADIDGLGVKAAVDDEGPPIDPDAELPIEATTEPAVRRYLHDRFPALERAPLVAVRCGRYEITLDTHFIAARIPSMRNCGSWAAARDTASSTDRRWPSGSPERSAKALRCRTASGWASDRREPACERLIPAAPPDLKRSSAPPRTPRSRLRWTKLERGFQASARYRYARQAAVVRRARGRSASESCPAKYGRCPARTGDLLLVGHEQLLPSAAACRSDHSASDESHLAAALCCGLALPKSSQTRAPSKPRCPFHRQDT